MPHASSYTTTLRLGWATIAMFAALGVVLSLIISFLQPLRYSSTVRLLITQDIGISVDAYTASRSEERIAQNLATILFTTTFFNQVLNAGFTIDKNSFPTEDYRRRREWRRTIDASVSRGAGLMSVTAYHRDVKQAEQIARAIAFVLTERVGDYTSGGNVRVRLIDAPLNSRWPVKPNVFANAVSGLVLGAFAGVAYVLLMADQIRRRHQLLHEDF
ncbi:MAG: hypothetical protein UY77_C0014G0013 [Candidatus Uhrbacteria bacterium GW2011_GWA2_53_10]|uniref:Polysaccharide chain length determinant N-terminal domain-containing protein n=1 Tax=Candidatus Uhrbacteria bacterium GW2011_GWA2_53_10 TaxID=1618980 RepID=A0A0G1XND3_9BACT|nr:MAG: hypothetical protein UY77_C0014G0013 [Candidatus Uhrbacteria bacterium GW2011_GWA2_53_10]